MREFVQGKPSVIILIAGVVLLLAATAIGVARVFYTKIAVAHAQSEPTRQTLQVESSELAKQPTEPAAVAQPSSANSVSTQAVKGDSPNTPSSKETSPVATTNSNDAVLNVHVVYDGSGQGCGKWVTEICYYPFAGRIINVRNSLGVTMSSAISDASGLVSFKLKPGNYTLVPGPGDTIHPDANSEKITIVDGSNLDITINYFAIAWTNTIQL